MKLVTVGRDSERAGAASGTDGARDGSGIRASREAALERGVSRRHLDSLVDNSVCRDALVQPLEVLPVDLLGVGAQGVGEELGEPPTRLDVVLA